MAIFIGSNQPGVIQTAEFNLAVDITTAVLSPAQATYLAGSITTVLASSFLDVRLYATVLVSGALPVSTNVAAAFRLLLNGVPIPASRAGTVNQPNSRVSTVEVNRRVAVSAGVQAVTAQWTRFGGGAGAILTCSPFTLPDLMGGTLRLQEQT